MILPLGDFPNPRGVPFVNHALISINVAIFLLQTTAAYQHFLDALDVEPSSQTAASARDALEMVHGRGKSYGRRGLGSR